MVIKSRFSIADGQGGSIPFTATLVFFKPTSTSVTRITFTLMREFDAQISPDVEAMIQSIRFRERRQSLQRGQSPFGYAPGV